ncbi:hypothetical protein PLESTB_001766200 [Pleodorina starrii]|uniref:Uncharacterized protein n=1 Tax=Pleodorina starrii TaxID=330485 RepID=A0A9W6F9R1_9CHLO|nr:hypothetical protein PLESTB_001766200 [Pleodorina starrii]GLC77302.1 hypothetical protein PLESTF_001917500 [Pleodorina starrii]
MTLLRPLGWQSLLRPVTPASRNGLLEAPVAFVLGLQYKTGDVMARTAPPLGFTLRGVELRTCRARAPLSALAPQRKHERATSQTATRLWRAPVSVLRSRAPSRAVSRAVVHGLGTHVVHDSEENDGGSGSGHTIGSVGGGGGGARPPLPDPLMWSSTRRNDDGATTTAWRTDGPGGGGTASHAATSASAVHLLQSAATPPPPPPCCGNPPSGSDRGAGKCTGQACVTALGRLGSLPRLPGAEAPSGREKGRSKGGAVASLPAAAASGGGRASGGSDGHGVAVALVVAVDLAVCDAAASVAAQSSDDGLPSAQPPPARCNPAATTAAGGEAALAPPPLPPPPLLPPPLPRNGGPPGGGGGNALNDMASHCVSLPHTGPASRRMTVPGYTTQGPATAVKAPAEGISAKLTETSFGSTEGSEEDCVPHEDAGVCGTCSGSSALEPPLLGRQRTPSGVVTQRCCGSSGSTASVGRG